MNKKEAEQNKKNLCEANLYEANLYEADLRRANLRGADLRRADLRRADLRGANLCGADLCGADLRGADLCGADLRGADLCEANLYGVNVKSAWMHNVKGYFSLPTISDTAYAVTCCAQYINNAWHIRVGCHLFTADKAKKYWGDDYKGDRAKADGYLEITIPYFEKKLEGMDNNGPEYSDGPEFISWNERDGQ